MKITFSEVFADETKNGTKLKTCDYQTSGTYPIIDQGQDFIAGYTDSVNGLYTDVPAIIFGDHTRILKYVDFPFFLGADGAKILKARTAHANYKYLYYALKCVKIPDTGYNRHFKWLKEATVSIPDSQKQEAIVFTLDSISRIISRRKSQLAKLDELVKCRFVELFGDPVTNSSNWEIKTIEQVCENLDYKRKPIASEKRVSGIYPYYGASGIVDYVDGYIFDEALLLISEDGANLLARNTPIAFSVEGKIWVNNHAHVLKFHDIASQKYVEALFSMIDISHLITGSAQPKLNQEKLNTFSIPWPPIHLQVQYNQWLYRIDKLRFVDHVGGEQSNQSLALNIQAKSLSPAQFSRTQPVAPSRNTPELTPPCNKS